MRSLTSTLTSEQKQRGHALYKLVLTKSGETTRTYSSDSDNILQRLIHSERSPFQVARAIVENSDNILTPLSLVGYQGVISYGYNTSAGDEYSATAPLKVISQDFDSGSDISENTCVFTLEGKANQMARDKSSGILKAGTATSTSAGKLVDTAATFVSTDVGRTVHNTTDNTWAIIAELVSATQVALSADIMVNTDTYDIMGSYEAATTATIETILTAILGATMPCFKHCEAMTLTWELTPYQEDELANIYKPADSFKVDIGQTRFGRVLWLMDKTGLDGRFEADGAFHVFQTFAREWTPATGIDLNEIAKPTVPSDWAGTTAYSLNARRKPTTQNGYYYICSKAGTSGGTEPAWPTQDGLTVKDGTVTWTCRDTNYVYTCMTDPNGTTGATEPVWPYTKDATVADSGVTWKLVYDYDYDDAADAHNFWRKGKRSKLVVPNKITVQSFPDALTKYSGSATEPVSFARLPKEDFINVRLASNAEAADLSLAMIDRAARDAETGSGLVPMNCGQEAYDYVLMTDSVEGDNCRGRVRSLTRYAGWGLDFKMFLQFGSPLARLADEPIPSIKFEQPVPEWVEVILDHIDDVGASLTNYINEVWARLQLYGDVIDRLDKDAYYKTFTFPYRCLNHDTDLVTGDGVAFLSLPRDVDGMNLIEVHAVVDQASAGVVATIQIYNVTQAADMLTIKVTVDVNESTSYTAATKPVIDTAEDDVAILDRLRFDCDVGETTSVWAASTAYVLNDKLRPTLNNQNGHKYNCTTGGTSGATEPTWPTGTGATVAEGPDTLVWTENGATLQGLTIIMKFRKA